MADGDVEGLDFNDAAWSKMNGGHRVPYDPRNALRALEQGDAVAAWEELWKQLHHQGKVGEASYAAVPHLVRIHEAREVADWNTYALVAAIEHARKSSRNPTLPRDFGEAYQNAWRRLFALGLVELRTAEDPSLVSSILAAIATAKGQRALGLFAALFDEEERAEILSEAGWSDELA